MLVRQGKQIHRVTLIMELIEQAGMNFSLVRLFCFDDEGKMVYKTERNYPLGEVLHVLYEHDQELTKNGFEECDYKGADEARSAGINGSRIWHHRWLYELSKDPPTQQAEVN